jgi:hypothetical protein
MRHVVDRCGEDLTFLGVEDGDLTLLLPLASKAFEVKLRDK